MSFANMSPTAIAEELGARLRNARLNADLTQAEVASRAGLSRPTVVAAEQGRVQLENFVAILVAMGMTSQLDAFLPVQEISPLQLAKLRGRQRQRASGAKHSPIPGRVEKDEPSW
ncbi:MAG: helix-turn-helix transcriptional regulator [Coriobacteriia bacterium]|nr:helix-turn-helix transcriptional regulator [Coriobacteriia bacterium]